MASLGCLPPELILEIANWLLHNVDLHSLACFSAVSRSLHGLVTPVLYTDFGAIAFEWAAQHGSIATLERAIRYADDEMDLINPGNFVSSLEHPLLQGDDDADPLHIAAKYGQDNVVTWLLDHGADITASSRGLCDCYYSDLIWEDREGESTAA